MNAQKSDEHLSKVWNQIEIERRVGYSISSDGGLLWQDCLFVPEDEKILNEFMTEAHDTSYTFHLGSTEMYQDLEGFYW